MKPGKDFDLIDDPIYVSGHVLANWIIIAVCLLLIAGCLYLAGN